MMEKLLHEQLREWADIAEREGLSIENVIAREVTDGLRGNLSCSDQIGLARILANEIECEYIPRDKWRDRGGGSGIWSPDSVSDSLEKLRDDMERWNELRCQHHVGAWVDRLAALVERGA